MWSHPPFQERGWEHPCKKDIVYVQFFPLKKGAGTRLGIGMEKTAVEGGGGGALLSHKPKHFNVSHRELLFSRAQPVKTICTITKHGFVKKILNIGLHLWQQGHTLFPRASAI